MGAPGDSFRRAGHDDFSAAVAAFGAEVDYVIGALYDVHIMLDDDDGVASVDEAVEDGQELADVVEVEAGGGLVEDVEGVFH